MNRHIAAGNIFERRKGLGTTRPLRLFTIEDVMRAKFLKPIDTASRVTGYRDALLPAQSTRRKSERWRASLGWQEP